MRRLRLLALLLVPPGFALPIAFIMREPASTPVAVMAAYVGGSLLIIGGYVALVLGTLPKDGGDRR